MYIHLANKPSPGICHTQDQLSCLRCYNKRGFLRALNFFGINPWITRSPPSASDEGRTAESLHSRSHHVQIPFARACITPFRVPFVSESVGSIC